MTTEEKAREIANHTECNGLACWQCKEYIAIKMAEWKEQQMMELLNVARNVYEAWMGGTMNDVRECMKDLGHVYDEFKDKGMY